jgi:hypothetical protein
MAMTPGGLPLWKFESMNTNYLPKSYSDQAA